MTNENSKSLHGLKRVTKEEFEELTRGLDIVDRIDGVLYETKTGLLIGYEVNGVFYQVNERPTGTAQET